MAMLHEGSMVSVKAVQPAVVLATGNRERQDQTPLRVNDIVLVKRVGPTGQILVERILQGRGSGCTYHLYSDS
jgi:hypothetical protein